MKILYIDHYAGTPGLGMEYRPFYMAREWVKAGHSVVILAASFAHTRTRNPEVQGPVTHQDIEGVHFIWLKTPAYRGNGVGRILNMAAFVLRLYRHLPGCTGAWRPDAVIASSTYPLDFYPARRIARLCKARLAFELHDLWPLSPMELGPMSASNPFIRVMQMAEDAWCRQCDVAVSILPYADRHLATRGLTADRFIHVPNGIDLAEWNRDPLPLPPAHQAFLDERQGRGRFLLGYAGAHGVANALDTLVEAAGFLKDQPIDLVLVGSGPERASLAAKARELGAGNVYFLDPVPKTAIPAWLGAMDALFLGFRDSALYRFGVSPNKLFDYMMAGKPIVCALSAGNDLVAEAGCGLTVPADAPAALAQAILALHQAGPQRRQAMGSAGKAFVLARHTYPHLSARFLEALQPVGAGQPEP